MTIPFGKKPAIKNCTYDFNRETLLVFMQPQVPPSSNISLDIYGASFNECIKITNLRNPMKNATQSVKCICTVFC